MVKDSLDSLIDVTYPNLMDNFNDILYLAERHNRIL